LLLADFFFLAGFMTSSVGALGGAPEIPSDEARLAALPPHPPQPTAITIARPTIPHRKLVLRMIKNSP
jgi:hypothetical protein